MDNYVCIYIYIYTYIYIYIHTYTYIYMYIYMYNILEICSEGFKGHPRSPAPRSLNPISQTSLDRELDGFRVQGSGRGFRVEGLGFRV